MGAQRNDYELQVAVRAAARASGLPVLDAGRGQPNWTATTPRAGFFRLGAFATAAAAETSALTEAAPYWGVAPGADGIADRLATALADDPSPGAGFLRAAVPFARDRLGFDADAWVHELVRGVLGAGYPAPNRMLRHVERVVEAYLVAMTGAEDGPPGRYRVFGTEGGAAAMAYVFRTLQENRLLRRGDRIAIATPTFTPYLQIPTLEDFGFDVVELRAAHDVGYRFDEHVLDGLRDPTVKAFFVVNPGNPDSRAISPARLAQLRELVLRDRPDLLIVADTAYATFVEGFRSILAELPRNTILLHSFSKNFGATGNRLGFVAVGADTVVDTLLAGQDEVDRAAARRRYGALTSDVAALPFVERLVADSREVALHNITGLATPDQVQMALFALDHLMPDGVAHRAAVRAELVARHDALLAPIGVAPPGGADAEYYALVDLAGAVTARHGAAATAALVERTDPADIPMVLARDHGVVVLPGAGFGGMTWDVRVCLAALSRDELAAVGTAIATVLDGLVAGSGGGPANPTAAARRTTPVAPVAGGAPAAPMDAREIRRAYLDMLVAHGHVIIPRAPLVLRDDPTTLFTGSGMQPLLPYLLGAEHPSGRRLGDIQPCLRAQDMNDVGDNRHTTFFEMLGNWSLGDYSKSVQIPMLWRFLTGIVGLPPERIYVSCFIGDPEHGIPRDDESAEIWTDLFREAGIGHERVDLGTEQHGGEVGNQGARIAFYGDKNWWSRFGGPDEMPVGDPGGPDSEVFFRFPQVPHDPRFGRYPHQNSDGGQYLEIGNSVFMQYRRTPEGFAALPHHNVDFGGGLERIAAASIDSPDVYRIDRLWPIVEALEALSGTSYDDATTAMRVVADHMRGAALLAADGVLPGNKAQAYVMRRLVRRALRYALELELTGGVAEKLVPVIAGIYHDVYPEIGDHGDHIVAVLTKEERTFARTLRKGLAAMRRLSRSGATVDGRTMFELHDTFGMPVELCVEEAARTGVSLSPLWQAEYDALMDAQRKRSHQAREAAPA